MSSDDCLSLLGVSSDDCLSMLGVSSDDCQEIFAILPDKKIFFSLMTKSVDNIYVQKSLVHECCQHFGQIVSKFLLKLNSLVEVLP